MYPIKIGYLLAYDYEMMKTSLPLVYEHADSIVLSLDKNRKTYKGNSFEIPESFFQWLKSIDRDNKITLYEDDFARPELTPMECEVRQRHMTSDVMGKGGWHIQIDVDEYFVSFKGFVEQLRRFEKQLKEGEYVTVYANWLTMFKKVNGGYLYPSSDFGYELCHIATNRPAYEQGRNTSKNRYLHSDNFILHDSWAREEAQLYQKLKNWSHSNDFNSDDFFAFWKSVDENNYSQFKNFHPIYPSRWQRLEMLKGETVQDLISYAYDNLESKIKPWKTRLRNIKGGGRLLKLIEKI